MRQGGAPTPRLPTPMANMPMARAPSGAMPPMRPSNAPMAPAPRIPAAPPRPTAPDSQGIASMVADKAKADLATAQGPEQLINAFRGNQKPIAARYQELAEYVGPNDAGRTPTSVLTMVQPTIMMTKRGAADSGIGQLMAGVTDANAPVEGRMGAGIMQQAPVRMQRGGDPRMADFQSQQAFLQQALGLDADDLRRRARSRGIVQAGLQGLTRQPRLGESAAQQILPTIFEALGAGSEADMAVDQLMRESVNVPAAQYALNQEQARKSAEAAREQKIFEKSLENPDFEPGYLVDTQTLTPAPNQPVVNLKDPTAVRNANIRAQAEGTVLVPASQIKAISRDQQTSQTPVYKTLFDPTTGRVGGTFDITDPEQKQQLDDAIATTGLQARDPKDVPVAEKPTTEAPEGSADRDIRTIEDILRLSPEIKENRAMSQSDVSSIMNAMTNYMQARPGGMVWDGRQYVESQRQNQLPIGIMNQLKRLEEGGLFPSEALQSIVNLTSTSSLGSGSDAAAPDVAQTSQTGTRTYGTPGNEVVVPDSVDTVVDSNLESLRNLDYTEIFGPQEAVKYGIGSSASFLFGVFEGLPVITELGELAAGSENEKAVQAAVQDLNLRLQGGAREMIGVDGERIADAFRQDIKELLPEAQSSQRLEYVKQQYLKIMANYARAIQDAEAAYSNPAISPEGRARAEQAIRTGVNFYNQLEAVISGIEKSQNRFSGGVRPEEINLSLRPMGSAGPTPPD